MSQISINHTVYQSGYHDPAASKSCGLWTPPDNQLPSLKDLFAQETWFTPCVEPKTEAKTQDYFSYKKIAPTEHNDRLHTSSAFQALLPSYIESSTSPCSDEHISGTVPTTPDTDEEMGMYSQKRAHPDELSEEYQRNQPNYIAKRHVCHLCNKRFPRPSSLRVHLHTHTGEKPYVCEFSNCQRRFSVLSNLRRHYKTHL